VLLLDVGNSRCKWAHVENGVWTHQGATPNANIGALQRDLAALPSPNRILVSNVAGEAMEQGVRSLCAGYSTPVEFVTARSEQCGVSNAYDHPAQLGSDRWSALIAAWRHQHRACLVVNCGTATTVDALSDTGAFLGGLILPGVTLMQQSLLHNAAQLMHAEGRVQDFPRNTADAIHSGVIRATLGAIQQQYALLKGAAAIGCVLSGGAAGQIQAHLGMPVERVDNLVLEGLQIIGEASA
jgi:type III pantothenate kinase